MGILTSAEIANRFAGLQKDVDELREQLAQRTAELATKYANLEEQIMVAIKAVKVPPADEPKPAPKKRTRKS